MEIKSNTIGKFRKMAGGTVFSNALVFVKEYLQNCQRARAKHVFITVDETHFSIRDDGCGCKPEDFLSFDKSSWKYVSEGFGIGGWSGLAVPELKYFAIRSRAWSAVIDVPHVLETGDLEIKINDEPYMKGFELTLTSEWFKVHDDETEEEARKAARYMPFVTVVNGCEVERSTIIDDFHPENDFSHTIRHRGYTAKFTPARRFNSDIKLYYDGREINTPWWIQGDVDGVIDIKPGTVTMKEPDRTEIIEDSLYRVFKRMVKEDIKATYRKWIEENGVENETYAENIASVLSVKDYDRYLKLDPSVFPVIMGKPEEENGTEEEAEDTTDDNANKNTYYVAASLAVSANKASFSEPDFKTTFTPVAVKAARKRRKIAEDGNFREGIRKLGKKSFYVKAYEAEEYKEAMAEADYAGLNVLIAKNTLYENAFIARNIPHISELQHSMVKTIERKESRLKTKKEEVFIATLNPIVEKYNLKENAFRLANLSEVTEVWLDGKRIYRRVVKNRPGKIEIFGETDHSNIFLDRTAMGLKNYRLSGGKMGVWEYKALLNAIPTIAHELAHYLYDTTDNTVKHYQAIEKLSHEIAELYRKEDKNEWK